MESTLIDAALAVRDTVVSVRRDLHRRPEVGLDLPLTRERVVRELADLPVRVIEHERCSGVVAVLEGGPGAPVLLRGDMDALPMTEDTGLDFASDNGAMHACGHDLHTAMLVGAVRVLAERRDELPGPVVFMFQPGEEGMGGADVMIGEGLLDSAGATPARALAIHVISTEPSGTLSARPGTMMASADEIRITVRGRGGHASAPHMTVDPVPVAAEIILAIETAVTRRISVFDPAVVTFGVMSAGTAHNVVPEVAELHGTLRTLSPERREHAQDLIRTVAAGIAAAHGASVEVAFVDGYPCTVNDPGMVELVEELAGSLGIPFSVPDDPIMGAEDFSYVLEKVPGAMAFLGAAPHGVDPTEAAPNHSNKVLFDEECMAKGIALYAAFALA